jgi:hypothetical protein
MNTAPGAASLCYHSIAIPKVTSLVVILYYE